MALKNSKLQIRKRFDDCDVILKIKTTKANEDVQISAIGTESGYSVSIYWGDGSVQTISGAYAAKTHRYSKIGTYYIRIPDTTHISRLIPVSNTSGTQVQNVLIGVESFYIRKVNVPFSGCFKNCTKLKYVKNLFMSPDGSSASCSNIFYNCTNLKTIDGTIDFIYSTNTNGSYTSTMFANCVNLVKLPDMINADKLRSPTKMFYGCTSLETLPDGFTMTGVTIPTETFSGCTNLKRLPAGFNVGSATNLTSFFNGCTSLEELPTSFNPSVCKNFTNIFLNCTSLRSLPSGFTIAKAENMTNMFYGCTSLETLPSGFTLPTTVLYMNNTFRNCKMLRTLPSTTKLQAKTVEMKNCFNGSGLTDLPSSFFPANFSVNTVYINNMFKDCVDLSGAVFRDSVLWNSSKMNWNSTFDSGFVTGAHADARAQCPTGEWGGTNVSDTRLNVMTYMLSGNFSIDNGTTWHPMRTPISVSPNVQYTVKYDYNDAKVSPPNDVITLSLGERRTLFKGMPFFNTLSGSDVSNVPIPSSPNNQMTTFSKAASTSYVTEDGLACTYFNGASGSAYQCIRYIGSMPLGASPRSFSIWLKCKGNAKVVTYEALASYGATENNQKLSVAIDSTLDHIEVYAHNNTTVHTNAKITTNIWHHLVYTFDGSNENVYIDNVLQSTLAHANINTQNLNPYCDIFFGSLNSGNQYYYGYLANARFYNYVISQSERTALYQEFQTALNI